MDQLGRGGRDTLTRMSNRPIKIALQLEPQHSDYRTMRDTLLLAEEIGVDIVFNWDHFFPLNGDPDGPHFECWTILAAWAETTSRVQLGPLVSCNGYRNPDLLADMARTVDHISGGRLILGIGSGWAERDFTSYGYEFPSAGVRIAELAAALPRVRRRLALLSPAPVRRIPLLIGGDGERKTLRLVAEHADIWHTFAAPDGLTRKVELIRGYCGDIGRDADEIEIAVGVYGVSSQVGPPEELGPRLRRLGASTFTVGVGGPDYDLGVLKSWIAWRDAQG
jgi:probable F420-dependent oxidoreductase